MPLSCTAWFVSPRRSEPLGRVGGARRGGARLSISLSTLTCLPSSPAADSTGRAVWAAVTSSRVVVMKTVGYDAGSPCGAKGGTTPASSGRERSVPGQSPGAAHAHAAVPRGQVVVPPWPAQGDSLRRAPPVSARAPDRGGERGRRSARGEGASSCARRSHTTIFARRFFCRSEAGRGGTSARRRCPGGAGGIGKRGSRAGTRAAAGHTTAARSRRRSDTWERKIRSMTASWKNGNKGACRAQRGSGASAQRRHPLPPLLRHEAARAAGRGARGVFGRGPDPSGGLASYCTPPPGFVWRVAVTRKASSTVHAHGGVSGVPDGTPASEQAHEPPPRTGTWLLTDVPSSPRSSAISVPLTDATRMTSSPTRSRTSGRVSSVKPEASIAMLASLAASSAGSIASVVPARGRAAKKVICAARAGRGPPLPGRGGGGVGASGRRAVELVSDHDAGHVPAPERVRRGLRDEAAARRCNRRELRHEFQREGVEQGHRGPRLRAAAAVAARARARAELLCKVAVCRWARDARVRLDGKHYLRRAAAAAQPRTRRGMARRAELTLGAIC